jgi:outer membrane protein insertion porin family
VILQRNIVGRRAGAFLLVGTILGGWAAPTLAQQADPLAPQETPAPDQPAPDQTQPPAAPTATAQPAPAVVTPAPPAQGVIRSISIRGNQRLEPETIRAYANLAPGQGYTAETLDTALRTSTGPNCSPTSSSPAPKLETS